MGVRQGGRWRDAGGDAGLRRPLPVYQTKGSGADKEVEIDLVFTLQALVTSNCALTRFSIPYLCHNIYFMQALYIYISRLTASFIVMAKTYMFKGQVHVIMQGQIQDFGKGGGGGPSNC